jgi:hypothetical protein
MPQLRTGTQQADVGREPEPGIDQPYLAVGVPLGRWPVPAGDENAPPAAIIRRGVQFLLVDLSTFELFLFAIRPRRRSELLAVAEDAGAGDPVEMTESMIGGGLLIPFGGDSDEDLWRLGALRLHPLGIGLGGDEGDRGSCRIARHDLRPLLVCDFVTYAVWAASDGRPLRVVCQQIAASYGLSPDDVLRRVVRVLPGLLESGAAFLDSTPGTGTA